MRRLSLYVRIANADPVLRDPARDTHAAAARTVVRVLRAERVPIPARWLQLTALRNPCASPKGLPLHGGVLTLTRPAVTSTLSIAARVALVVLVAPCAGFLLRVGGDVTALPCHVSHVGVMVAKKQVIQADAVAHIAVVADVHALGDRTVGEFPREPMGSRIPAGPHPQGAVSVDRFCPRPQPAVARLVDAPPKASLKQGNRVPFGDYEEMLRAHASVLSADHRNDLSVWNLADVHHVHNSPGRGAAPFVGNGRGLRCPDPAIPGLVDCRCQPFLDGASPAHSLLRISLSGLP